MESNLRRLRTLSLAVTVLAALVSLAGLGIFGWSAKEEYFPEPEQQGLTSEQRDEVLRVIEEDRSRPAELAGYAEEEPEDGIYYRSEGYDPETDTFINETQFEAAGYTTPEMQDEEVLVYNAETNTYETVTTGEPDGPSTAVPPYSPFREFLEFWMTPTGLASLGFLFLSLVFFVASLMWVWRAHENLRAHGMRLKNTPRRAVGNYLIPGLNLVLPFEAMRELYNRSEGEPEEFANASVSDVNAWWTAVAVGLMVFVFLFAKEVVNAGTAFYFITPSWMDDLIVAFALLLLMGSTLLFAGLTRRISEFQAQVLPQIEPVEILDEPRIRPTVRIIHGDGSQAY